MVVESGTQSSETTTCTVTPEDKSSRVRIETRFKDAGGVPGFFERRLAPRFLKPLFEAELVRLDCYAQEHKASP